MKHDERLQRQHEVLKCLSNLPRMVLMLKEHDNIPEFVLHDLSCPACFNLCKVAYFVDNPDFDCLRGIAGFCRDELSFKNKDIWQNPKDFSAAMESSPFNQKVRSVECTSKKRLDASVQELVTELANILGIIQPSACTWNMKHDNYGLLVFEKAAFDDTIADEYLLNGASMLSFCPIF